jgi:hypothetical protein
MDKIRQFPVYYLTSECSESFDTDFNTATNDNCQAREEAGTSFAGWKRSRARPDKGQNILLRAKYH